MGDMPQHLYSPPPPPTVPAAQTTAPPSAPVSNFLEAHGTVIVLALMAIMFYGAVFYLALRLQIDPKEIFAFFAGAATTAFGMMGVAMRVSSGTTGK